MSTAWNANSFTTPVRRTSRAAQPGAAAARLAASWLTPAALAALPPRAQAVKAFPWAMKPVAIETVPGMHPSNWNVATCGPVPTLSQVRCGRPPRLRPCSRLTRVYRRTA